MIKILIDMNLSPAWVNVFTDQGWEAVHWPRIGDYNASDRTILDWAKSQNYIIFTHDLDFGSLLAASSGDAPILQKLKWWQAEIFPVYQHCAVQRLYCPE